MLGTKHKTLKFGAGGSRALYPGAASPGREKEVIWLPAPNGEFSLSL